MNWYFPLTHNRGVNGYKPVLSVDLRNWSIGFDFERHNDGKYERVTVYLLCVVLYINKYMGY